MKIKVEKQPAIYEEVDVALPCFRKNAKTVTMVEENRQTEIRVNGEGMFSYSFNNYEYFRNEWTEATKEEFVAALDKHLEFIDSLNVESL